MKLTPTLDRDDRAALVRLGSYAVLFGLCVLSLLVLALALGVAVRIFEWAS